MQRRPLIRLTALAAVATVTGAFTVPALSQSKDI